MLQLFVNRSSTPNVGDRFCSPVRYFGAGFRMPLHLDIRSAPAKQAARWLGPMLDLVVVGGGGLIGRKTFKEDIDFWTSLPAPRVLWGAGYNSNTSNHFASVLDAVDKDDYSQLSRFDLVGIRDWGVGYNWVPCVSCFDSVFDKNRAPRRTTNSILIALNEETIHDRKNFELIIMSVKTFGKDFHVIFNHDTFYRVISEISTSDIVITNSFHCAYWSVLLERRVIVIGGGSKVRRMRHQIPSATPHSWREAVEQASVYKEALEECRQANSDFAARVRRLS